VFNVPAFNRTIFGIETLVGDRKYFMMKTFNRTIFGIETPNSGNYYHFF